MTETARSQQKTFTKAQSFAVQMIIRHSIAPRGCINFTAIWQTLAVLMMLPVIARELSRKNRK
jgi:hypothetical protein